jgi:hypothetical protein
MHTLSIALAFIIYYYCYLCHLKCFILSFLWVHILFYMFPQTPGTISLALIHSHMQSLYPASTSRDPIEPRPDPNQTPSLEQFTASVSD